MKIHGKKVILFQILYILFSGMLIEAGLPQSIRYLSDVVNVGLVLFCIRAYRPEKLAGTKLLLGAFGIWWLFMVVSAVIGGPSVFLIAWATRNWCRGLILFLSCLLLLDKTDVQSMIHGTFYIYVLNLLVSCGQALFSGKNGDYVGGIFGTTIGCNGYNNLFLSAALVYVLCDSFLKQRLSAKATFILISVLFLAGLGEIKVLFMEYLMLLSAITVLFLFRRKLKWTFFWRVLVASVVGFVIGLAVLYLVSPGAFAVMIGKNSLSHYEMTSRPAYRISRIYFFPEINELYFQDSVLQRLIGYGFGNCEMSKFGFLCSAFGSENGRMNYHFFSHQPLYLEGGLIGLGLFCMIWAVTAGGFGLHLLKSETFRLADLFGFLFCGLMLINVFYNNAFRTEVSYLVYCILAMPYRMLQKE